MSRLPPPPSRSSRTPQTPLKSSTTSTGATPSRTRTLAVPTTPSSRTRTTSTNRAGTPTKKAATRAPGDEGPARPASGGDAKPALSIKEAIALKRAQAKKAAAAQGSGGRGAAGLDDMATLEDALPASGSQVEEDADLLGRLPLRETIEKSRSTGTLNLATRDLPCLPSGLFEIHLNITPDPLKSVENEPKLPPAEENPPPTRRGGSSRNQPAWFEAQDLTVLKAWNNEITEIQHEISLFGSLKTVDLHKNKLTTLPNTFADLSFLTNLDLSHNLLTSLPDNLWALPELKTLNISHNHLTALPFTAPFKSSSKRTGPNSYASTTDFFTPAIVRATHPLPKLIALDASYNAIASDMIDLDVPAGLTTLDLSSNPLGNVVPLLQKLATLPRIKEVRFEKAQIADGGSLPADLLSNTTGSTPSPFPELRLLDLSETTVTLPAVQRAFGSLSSSSDRELDHNFTIEEPPSGVVRILVGKRVVKEAWEIELERKSANASGAAKAHGKKVTTVGHGLGGDWDEPAPTKAGRAEGLVGPEVSAPREDVGETPSTGASAGAGSRGAAVGQGRLVGQPGHQIRSKKEVVKEAWEIEAEQGMLTEGGKRRARAAAAAANAASAALNSEGKDTLTTASGSNTIASSSGSSLSSAICGPQYYDGRTQTLTLPASAPAPKVPNRTMGHGRSFSLASPLSMGGGGRSVSAAVAAAGDIALPAATLPLSVIAQQGFAESLKVLVLKNRRLDRSFVVPGGVGRGGGFGGKGWLPRLEELDLEGCNLEDLVCVRRVGGAGAGAAGDGEGDGLGEGEGNEGGGTTTTTNEPILSLIAQLFPNLRVLNLSYNKLTDASLSYEALSTLIMQSPERTGLRVLRLRGNRLVGCGGLGEVAGLFRGFREVGGWKMEEVDLRDNEIGRLEPGWGMLPLDVFLVEGNTFRVPQARVWEREGTKGLLSWLRGRMV